jgi:hypothetical protein
LFLLGSPFVGDLTQPVFRPVAGYPRRLCLYNNVQLYDQYLCAPHPHAPIAIPTFPISDLLYTGLYSLAGTLTSSRPPRKPPYLPRLSHGWCSNNIHTVSEKRCYLSAYVGGPPCARLIPFSPTAAPICIDSSASLSVSNSREDFVNIHPVADKSLSGISTGLPIAGIGTIKWALMTDSGVEVDLHIHHSLYVPQCPMNLLSPQHLAQQTKRTTDGFSVFANVGILKFGGHTRTVLLDRASNLPIMHTLGHQSALPTTSSALAHPLTSLQVYTSKLDNLSQVQHQLLWVHYCLGHPGMDRIQALARAGILPKHLASCPKPLCTSCQLGKAHRSATPSTGTPLDVGHLNPGDCVSVDQLESNTPGSVPTSWGLPTKCTFQATTLFCDHASRYLFLKCHQSTGAAEAVAAKRAFEHEAGLANVTVRKYKADNGIFNSILWKSTCDTLQQANEYCGVNAHHQNGIAERQIRSIFDRARTMLLHALNKWPDVVTVSLWPYALWLAVDLHNATPGQSGLSPAEIFAGTKDRNRLADFHTFGCPVFVLEARLQAGHKIPKWEPRSRMAVYLGRSPQHASNVPLVMNIKTGLVSPQYHVVFDDHFTTTQCLATNVLPAHWKLLFQERSENVLADNPILQDSHILGPEWESNATPTPLGGANAPSLEGERHISPRTILTPPLEGDYNDPLSTTVRPHPSEGESPLLEGDSSLSYGESPLSPGERPLSEGENPLSVVEFPLSEGASALPPGIATGPVPNIASRDLVRPGWNHSHSHNTRFKRRVQANFAPVASNLALSPVACATAFVAEQTALASDESGTPTSLNPFTHLAAETTNTLHYGQMLRDIDRPKFQQVMQDEIDGLFCHDTLQIVESSMMPPNTKPLSAIWSFRRKRLPCWTIVKGKSRLCPHGGQQVKGINFWHTYAPIVKWSTVQLTLILMTLLGYQSRQIDFVQAFSQADIDCDVYMKIPWGFVVQRGRLLFDPRHSACQQPYHHVLKLKKNLYGLRQAGYNWHEKLKQGLLHHGFRQSVVDPCLFLRHDCILVVYVDDCLLFSKEASALDALIASLKKEFILTVEGDVSAFLGIDIKHHSDGRLELVQPGLINKTISECGLQENSHTHDTPSDTKILNCWHVNLFKRHNQT